MKRISPRQLLALLAAICIFGLGAPLLSSESCGLTNSCGDSCYVTAPPGGRAFCRQGPVYTHCTSFDANGNVVENHQYYCPQFPTFP